jgi:hypothetical protein
LVGFGLSVLMQWTQFEGHACMNATISLLWLHNLLHEIQSFKSLEFMSPSKALN